MTGPHLRRAAVLGSPIGHSLSPVLHRAAYASLGLSGWTYEAYDVAEADLPGFVSGLDGSWAGLSLTMPLKAAVLPLLDGSSPVVEAVGAANTVLLREGRRLGDNTDVPGMVAALADAGVSRVDRAVVLGGGATARSAVVALAAVTSEVTAYVRSPERAAGLAAAAAAGGVRLSLVPWSAAPDGLRAPLVVNTTPVGAADRLVPPGRPGVLFEVLYDPWPTPLVAAWRAQGGLVVDGLALLVHQAVLQVGLMTGAEVDARVLAPVLRAAGERALRTP